MTRERIIAGLKGVKESFNLPFPELRGENIEALDAATEVIEQQRWIPVSERLPEMHEAPDILKKFVSQLSDEVLVTIQDKTNGTRTVRSKCHLWDGEWHGDIFDWLKACQCDFEVIAWMTLPEPMEG